MLAVDRFHRYAQELFTRLLNANGICAPSDPHKYDEAVYRIVSGTVFANRWHDTLSHKRSRRPTVDLAKKIKSALLDINDEGHFSNNGRPMLFKIEELDKLIELAKSIKDDNVRKHSTFHYGYRNANQSFEFLKRYNDRLMEECGTSYKIGADYNQPDIGEITRFAYEQIHQKRAEGELKGAYKRFDILRHLVMNKRNPLKLSVDDRFQLTGLLVGMGNFLMRSIDDADIEFVRRRLIESAKEKYENEPMFKYMDKYSICYNNPKTKEIMQILDGLWHNKEQLPVVDTPLTLYTVAGGALLYRAVLSVLARGGQVDTPSSELKGLTPYQAMRISISHNMEKGIFEDAIVELEVLAKYYCLEGSITRSMDIINEIDSITKEQNERVRYRFARVEYQKSVLFGLLHQPEDRDRSISKYKELLNKFDVNIKDVSRLN